MTINLPQHIEEWIHSQVKTGQSESPLEFIQDMLEAAYKRQQAQAQLETLLDRGFADLEQGKVHSIDSLEAFRSAVQAKVRS